MENISGFARVLAKARVQQEQTKPLLGKPFLKYGQCYALAGYFMQVGAVLAVKHGANIDVFGHALLGLHGESGAFQKYVDSTIEDHVARITEPMTFSEYVESEQIERFEYKGDSMNFLMEYGLKKITPDVAAEMAWQFAEQGVIIGAGRPDIAHMLFDHTNRPRSQKDWDDARKHGLNIPEHQDIITWEETTSGENEVFMAYCQQCCPSYHAILIKD